MGEIVVDKAGWEESLLAGRSGIETGEEPGASRLEIENCLVSLVRVAVADKSQDVKIEPADFDNKFGPEVADFLRRVDCRQVSVVGDEVKLKLGKVYQERVNQGVEQFRLQKDVSFKARRDGDAIVMEKIKGIDVDPYYYPFWKSVPDIRLTQGKLSMYGIISFNVDPSLYDSVDSMLKRLGR